MKNPGIALCTAYSLVSTPSSFLIQLGRREIFICRDCRKRHYKVHPIIEFSTGIEAGHLEVLLFRKWQIIFS